MNRSAGILPQVLALPRGRRLDFIVWLFVAIVVCLLIVAVYSVELLSAGRAFVSAEAVWSRSQKEAVFHLTRYALDHNEADFLAFERAIAVPLGDRKARVALTKPEPDYGAAADGFLQGRNHPAEIDSMIALFARFRSYGPVERAVALWELADVRVDELMKIGGELRGAGATLGPDERSRQVDRIAQINASLAMIEDAIAATLAEGQRTTQGLLLGGMLLLAGLLLVAGILISQRFVLQNERLQRALRENEAQLRELIESAPLPLLIVHAGDQKLRYANARALQQLALNVDTLESHSLADFHVDPQISAALRDTLSRQGSVRDYEVNLRDLNGQESWFLLSAQPIRFAGETALLAALANIDVRKRVADDMRRRALHDQLTGLPNRAMFMEALERAIHKGQRRGSRLSVLFVDLDRFKEVNDTLGHAAGDKLLLAVAERLTKAVRQSDMVARLAGDEFVLLIEDHKGPEDVLIVGQKVLEFLERPVLLEWREVKTSASIGIASFPEDGADVTALMEHADTAMYLAKERGRNNFQFYSDELNRISRERSALEKRVRGALDNSEFFLQYQPEIELATGNLTGVEALLRWRNPDSGVILPPDFLPQSEENGTIIDIGRWVLERALCDLKAWQDQGLDVELAVNLSARQLQDPDLANDVHAALRMCDIAPGKLRLEVSEAALMADSAAADRSVRALRALGVRITVDNFGVGYSSLGLLRGFSADAVKIDRSLVSGCIDKRACAAIVQGVGAMAKNLGVIVIAAGVETEEERRMMATLGCDRAQGNLIGRPAEWARIARLTDDIPRIPAE